MELVTAADSERVQRHVAAVLAARCVLAGERVGIVATASAGYLGAVLGALRTGVVPVLVNPALLAGERDDLLVDAQVSLVWDDLALSTLTAAAFEPFALQADLAAIPLARPMHYTSGTTGRPKGVWSGVWSETEAAAWLGEERDLWGFDPADLHLVCGPLHHSAPVRFSTATLMAGGRVLIPGPFDAAGCGRAIADFAPTSGFLAPVHLQRLLALPRSARPDLRCFRLLAHAGAPCPENVKRAALAAARPGAVWEFYGSTEGQVTACPPDVWEERPGTVGRARAGRRIEIEADGTIWCHAPVHAHFSYWGAPDKTEASWRGDAFTVGDLGRLDDDGYLYLDGRRDDLIITGGVNVYPAEVEQALLRLDGVSEAAVFGRQDADWGQRVCAAVVGGVVPDAVIVFAHSHLAGYKCPKEVHIVDAIPMTSTGKLRRSTLAADLGLGGADLG